MLMDLFNEALHEFLNRERNNIQADISERNLCGRLCVRPIGQRVPRTKPTPGEIGFISSEPRPPGASLSS